MSSGCPPRAHGTMCVRSNHSDSQRCGYPKASAVRRPARTLGGHSYFVPVEHTTVARKELGTGPLLAAEQAAVLDEEPASARTTARRHMKRYLELENYTNNLRRLGWSDADLADGGSDRLVDAIAAWGGTATIKARINEHRKRGADHVCLQVLRADPKGSPTADLERIAKAVL